MNTRDKTKHRHTQDFLLTQKATLASKMQMKSLLKKQTTCFGNEKKKKKAWTQKSMQCKYQLNLTPFMWVVINSFKEQNEGEKVGFDWVQRGQQIVTFAKQTVLSLCQAAFILISFLGSHTHESLTKEGDIVQLHMRLN